MTKLDAIQNDGKRTASTPSSEKVFTG